MEQGSRRLQTDGGQTGPAAGLRAAQPVPVVAPAVDIYKGYHYIGNNFTTSRKKIRKESNIMAEGVAEISDSDFESEVLQSDKPVLVDFWAPWCGPCKAIGPVVEDLAGTFGGQIKFLKCNVDDNPITPGKFGIKAIPTLIFFKGGNVVDQITGMVAKSRLEESINKVL
jgi:thioredoxin 1